MRYNHKNCFFAATLTPMASAAYSAQFIETTLFCTNPFALSYHDSKQKWLIRKHLLALIQNYPVFFPSTDTFFHNDGTTANLLNASGDLHISSSTPPIHLTIWLHENYPYTAPLVFVSSSSSSPIHPNHPFVDLSGATSSPYLLTWMFPKYNLTELVHNLLKLFTHDHPLIGSTSRTTPPLTHPSLVSKMEALDRLSGMLHYDMMAFMAQSEADIDDLSNIREELVIRKGITSSMISEHEEERNKLEERVKEMVEEADGLEDWLQVNGGKLSDEDEVGFEGDNEESRLLIDCLAANRGIEDLMEVLDKAIEQELVSFDGYIRQVRVLARQQFLHRALLVKLRGPDVLVTSFD